MKAPGSHRACDDTWGPFERCARGLEANALVLADERVLALHPKIRRALNGAQVVALKAGEQTKSMAQLTRLSNDAPRACSAVVVIGGGTLGDLGTVLAHLIRRGVPLIQVPTTLLAAVDSSVGGKGAVHARTAGAWVKNAWGVFHYPERAWLCPELWETLDAGQRRQGAIEALKMDATLDAKGLARWAHGAPADLVRRARALKARVCAADPYDSGGPRRVLNFGHTFGHAFEAVTRFRLPHGDAVALGMLRALDLGAGLGVTPRPVATGLEAALRRIGAPPRRRLDALLRRRADVERAIAADKKGASVSGANMVLLERLGSARVHWVSWRAGAAR
jgi:3-dehydroquinate synthase